jgi:hypothetical protein
MPKLADIAADMLAQARRTGEACRPIVSPSELEISLCRAYFKIPNGAEMSFRSNAVLLRWPE